MASNLDARPIRATLIQRVLAGDNSLVPTLYQPALGGVDRSTVAVIGTEQRSSTARARRWRTSARPTACSTRCVREPTGGPCDLPGRELWAYLPRTSLSTVRYNTARIDGSPRVLDAYGDFTSSGTKAWRTILMFQTGWGDTSGADRSRRSTRSTSPIRPTRRCCGSTRSRTRRRAARSSSAKASRVGAGQVQIGSTFKWVAFAQTNNAGTGGAGNVVTAIDMETGHRSGSRATCSRRRCAGGTSTPPSTGIPGGAVAVDKIGDGFVTDVVFGTLVRRSVGRRSDDRRQRRRRRQTAAPVQHRPPSRSARRRRSTRTAARSTR